MPVEDFVLEENYRIGIADCGLQQSLCVSSSCGRDHLETRNVRIPGRIILTVLGGDTRGGTVRSAKNDLTTHLSARHIERLGRRVDQLVHCLHGEIEG